MKRGFIHEVKEEATHGQKGLSDQTVVKRVYGCVSNRRVVARAAVQQPASWARGQAVL